MPRKQRFKPSRKPKPPIEDGQQPVQQPMSEPSSSKRDDAGLEPAPHEVERRELHPEEIQNPR
jgi:hypothetical protein